MGGFLAPEDSSPDVVALRQRLAAQGYGAGGGGAVYDAPLVQRVMQFQRDHGLTVDGIVGKATLGEVNKDPEDRLESVIVAMERERWMNFDLGARHVWVNLPDFTAQIMDGDAVAFETRAVIGKTARSHRSPEFSDVMDYLVINPTWNVPRSITVREYLPMLQKNRYAAGHLRLLDRNGRRVPRSAVNFNAYDARSFPYVLKQPPGPGNALGTVKFIFPNSFNIYLHDTPAKALFERDLRAFSHGCIRLNQPHGFAHVLLARQSDDAEALFQRHLDSGRETVVRLQTPVPVHIVYRTAFARGSGAMQYRRDIYGRDKAVSQALQNAGVSMQAVRS